MAFKKFTRCKYTCSVIEEGICLPPIDGFQCRNVTTCLPLWLGVYLRSIGVMCKLFLHGLIKESRVADRLPASIHLLEGVFRVAVLLLHMFCVFVYMLMSFPILKLLHVHIRSL